MTGRDRERGSAAAELAVVTPLLLMFVLLMVLAGRVTSAHGAADEVAHAAARAASMERDAAGAEAAGNQMAASALASHGLRCADFSLALDHGGLQPGGAVTAALDCNVALGDLSLLNVPGTVTVRGESTVVIDTFRGTP
ncbi:TadE/TadG family type IV pilus assembly protein [Marinitenerispora sediminis]|uniref:TadE/TadG family type IV pilus assembly protein n=1 Tax=Marinitenerispora sediminis TaxID=1931232 RepID=UPI0021639673|nr:TadE/TadG family type IV pilus assembly protein [Marinitenerispora sediminis]